MNMTTNNEPINVLNNMLGIQFNYNREDDNVMADDTMNIVEEQVQYYNPDNGERPISGTYCPPMNRHFTCINVSTIPEDKIAQIIGNNGKIFKAISHQSGVDYIYWIKEKNIIEVWGYEHLLPNAVERIFNRINLVMGDTYDISMQT